MSQLVSVVVPVYDSEATLEPLVERVSASFSGIGRPFEIIFVDDGSMDGSWEMIARLSFRCVPDEDQKDQDQGGTHDLEMSVPVALSWPGEWVNMSLDDQRSTASAPGRSRVWIQPMG